MGFGVLTGISIGLLNESLGFNSVGFYQGKLSALVGSSFLILQRTRQKKQHGRQQAKMLIMRTAKDYIS